jgi:predicted nucleic acid-binding protein
MDMMLNSDIMGRFQTLGLEYHLSAYDAAYLELAQRTGLGLATGDRPLRLAAQRAGIKLISKA